MKRSLVMAALCSSSVPVHAQPEAGIAFKGGPNAATLAEDNRSTRYGFSGGLGGHLQWPVIERLALAGQVDLLYTPRGAEVISGGEYLGRTRQHYVDIMVAARPEARLGPVGVYLLVGGGLNLLLSASREEASGVKQDITDGLHRVDIALLAGVGVALQLSRGASGPFRPGTVFLEARHDHGLLDTDALGGYKNRSSSLMLGLSFSLSSRQPPPPPEPSPPPATPGESPEKAPAAMPPG